MPEIGDDSWRRVEELFLAALDVPEEQRAAFLDRECGSDAELRKETESLLKADTDSGKRISMVVEDSAYHLLDRDSMFGKMLGPYQVMEEIGRGGMGTVYAAARADREYQKRVAVKVVKRGVDTDAVLERFRHERQILAGLDHPYITRLIDGGTSSDGRPYFVMELVEGRPITTFCREKGLGVRERCELFRKVCEAVAYAHRNLVIHRDLKPINILVTAEGTPKLLDFGIARLLNLDPGQSTVGAGERPPDRPHVHTPAYASPEQLRGEPLITTTDVYSLGVVLYEILSERTPPPDRGDSTERTIHKPSETAQGKELKRALAGDLDNIVMKATHPEQALRYQSVDHLSDDLQRYLDGRPVLARDDQFTYRARKFLMRNRLAVSAAVLVIASLAGGLAFSIREQRKTQKRFNEVRALANSILFELHGEIAKLPGATRARSMVLQKALTYLDGLAKDSAGDMSLQVDLAQAYLRVGELQSTNMGDGNNSIVSFTRALNIARAANAAAPTDVRRKLLLVESLSGLGREEALSGQIDLGRRHMDESSKILDGVVAEGSNVEAMQLSVRQGIVHAGLARNEGEYLRALADLKRAEASAEQARKTAPSDTADYMASLVKWNLAIVESQTGDLRAASDTLEDAGKMATDLAARHPENAGYVRQVWVDRQARALFAGSPRTINGGDFATSLALYKEAEDLHRRAYLADKASIRYHVDYIAANFGVALITSEISPEKGLAMLQENIKLCLELAPGMLETNLSNFSVAIVYRTAALTAAKLKRWGLARDYLARAYAVQDSNSPKRSYFLTRLEHACLLREMADVELGAGNREAAVKRYREALAEFDALADHRREIFWVWRTTEALEGLGDALRSTDRAGACAMYARSAEEWNRWKRDGGPDSIFFRNHLDRTRQRSGWCAKS